MPPSRTIGFNPEVRHNDAMLINSISRHQGLAMTAARMELETEIASMRHQLDLTGEYPLGRLGMLTRGDNSEYPLFEPSADSLPQNLFNGFQAVKCSPLDSGESEVEEYARPRVLAIPTPLKVVASVIVVMVALGILYSTTGLVNGSKTISASLDTGISSRIEQSACAYETLVDENVSREIVLNIAKPVEDDETLVLAQQVPSSESRLPDATQRYLLVVGSFPSLSSANRHIAYVGDESLRVIEMDGNYRVYAGTAPTIDAARQVAIALSTAYPNVWICRR